MFAISQFAVGIAVIHFIWAFFYLCGTVVWAPRLSGPPPVRKRGTPGALLEVVIATATGMAIVGFISFVLGIFGLLYPPTALVLAVALLGAFSFLGDSPFRRSFWTIRLEVVAAALTPTALALYACVLLVAVPATFPETAFDALFYHLVYALDWSHAHRIYVDPWVRFPYYAQNWILLDTWMFELGLGSYIDFLGWLGGALSILAVCGLVDALAERLSRQRRGTVQVAAFISALAVLLAPVFERWVDTGMVDVAIGFFFIASVASTVMAVTTRDRRWAVYAILCFAFFVGTKASFVVFIPVAVIAAWVAMRATRQSIRASCAACVIALILCVPWYTKNFIQAGDPIAPYLNLAFHGRDSKFSLEDMQGVMADLRGNQTPLFLLALPIDIVLHPDTNEYREFGVTLLMMLVFVPGIVLVYGLRRRGQALSSPWFIYSALLFYAIAYWLVTSHLARYALLFYPALAAFVGLIALRLAHGSVVRRSVVFALLACTALPAPAGAAWLSALWQADYINLDATYPDARDYLSSHLPDYGVEELVSTRLTKAAIADPRVYAVGDFVLPYYFKLHGVTQIGDWFGPERYPDFARAIDRGTAPDFLANLRINAVLVSPNPLFPSVRISRLEDQLKHAGYREERLLQRTSILFFAPGV